MKLLGDWNWYLPSWLEWLPHVGAEDDAVPPVVPEEPPARRAGSRRSRGPNRCRCRRWRHVNRRSHRPPVTERSPSDGGAARLGGAAVVPPRRETGTSSTTSLADEVTTWQIVHVGTLVFIGLMGVALYLLVRDVPGRAAAVSRLAIGPFVLFYGAWEAVIGLATGALVQHANDVPAGPPGRGVGRDPEPAGQRHRGRSRHRRRPRGPRVGHGGDRGGGRLPRPGRAGLGSRAPGLSVVVVSHPPPIGPMGLVCFAAAAGLLAFSQRTSRWSPHQHHYRHPRSGSATRLGSATESASRPADHHTRLRCHPALGRRGRIDLMVCTKTHASGTEVHSAVRLTEHPGAFA